MCFLDLLGDLIDERENPVRYDGVLGGLLLHLFQIDASSLHQLA